MPFGLDAWPLHVMGWGIDVMLAMGRWVSGLPGAVTIVAAWPLAALVLIGAGRLVDRDLAAALALAGAGADGGRASCSRCRAPAPDMLVARDARTVAVRGATACCTFPRPPRTITAARELAAARRRRPRQRRCRRTPRRRALRRPGLHRTSERRGRLPLSRAAGCAGRGLRQRGIVVQRRACAALLQGTAAGRSIAMDIARGRRLCDAGWRPLQRRQRQAETRGATVPWVRGVAVSIPPDQARPACPAPCTRSAP